MVKQGLAAEAGANSLWQRYQQGDLLVNAAIEQYAESHDVSEFLETIQLLSSLSQEEIDALMQNAADKLDEEGEDIQATKKYQAEQQEEESESSEESDESDESDESSEQSKNDIEEPIRAKEKSDTEEKESEDEIASPSTSREPTRREKAQAPEEFPLAALSELSQRDLLTPEEAGCLARLVLSQDANILAVFDVFRDMQDTEDLIDSLKRIARLTRATQGSTPQGTPKAAAEVESKSNDESSQESMSSDESEESDVEPGQTPPLNAPLNAQAALGLPPADQKKVVQILANSGIFTAEQVAFLERLVDIRNPTISNLFITHERERNVEALIVGLMKALPVGHSNTMTKDKLLQSQASVDVSKNQQQAESEESEESEEDESADSDDSREEIDSLSVEKKFLENIRNMSLSHLNTAALRLAIAR